MKWFILVVAVIVLCFVVALVLGLAGGGLGRNTTSLSHEPLPDESIRDSDFDDLVFDVGARGYRMSQVDGVVDRLRRELREKDEEIAVLRGDAPAQAAAEGPAESPAGAPAEGPAEGPAEASGTPDPAGAPETAEVHEPSEPSEPTVGREPTP
ncbi:hypothetical protein GCM10009868_23610 [Terrabacter aerolatus]|uniref:Cell division protein DivIVA n=1 Tax=Terrabacter aerolatus TaxID=422442 RepID=A0A512D5J3_9MICO|nr:cell division protein DivIVA [Terrabacter aerolatus]GEO31735.1 hypothetical protein TAE01_35450 [Terrabacter aerolatus]